METEDKLARSQLGSPGGPHISASCNRYGPHMGVLAGLIINEKV